MTKYAIIPIKKYFHLDLDFIFAFPSPFYSSAILWFPHLQPPVHPFLFSDYKQKLKKRQLYKLKIPRI